MDYAEQGDITNLDIQMKMIRHQAIGMDAMLVFFYAFLEEKKESASILFVKKNILTGVASQDDMVTSARIMESRFSWHGSQRNSRMPTCQSRLNATPRSVFPFRLQGQQLG
jgi:hypothetical protein